MKKRSFLQRMLVALLAIMLIQSTFLPSLSLAGTTSFWTVDGPTREAQQENHFALRSDVYIWGNGFDPDTEFYVRVVQTNGAVLGESDGPAFQADSEGYFNMNLWSLVEYDLITSSPFTYKVEVSTSSQYENRYTNSSNFTLDEVAVVNTPPVAVDDAYQTDVNQALEIAAPGILGNDTDADEDPLTAIWVSDPAHGSLDLDENGSFIYTPDPDFVGTDSFTYMANDGTANSNVATVTITINAGQSENTPPVAVDDAYQTDVNQPLEIAAPGILGNDTDADEDPLTAIWVSDPAHGSLDLDENGSFIYTPDPDFVGTDSFTYMANDGTANSNVATVTIQVINPSVNNPPVAVDDTATTNVNTPVDIAVLTNDSDPDGDTIHVSSISVTDPEHGTATLNPNCTITYTPDAGYHGTDSFTYYVYDGELISNVATVTITINAGQPVNNPPHAADDSYETGEGEALTVSAPGILGNDTDADEDDLTAVLVDGPDCGELVLNADGSFTYTPTAECSGQVEFTYKVYDGEDYSNIATVTITIVADEQPVNNAPIAANDSESTDEDEAVEIDVLDNDSDPDGDDIHVVPGSISNPNHGTATLNEDGTITYTPDDNFDGVDSFTYYVNDGKLNSNPATVTVTVREERRRPNRNNDDDEPIVVNVPDVAAPPEPVVVTPQAPMPVAETITIPVGPAPAAALPATGGAMIPFAAVGSVLIGLGLYLKRY